MIVASDSFQLRLISGFQQSIVSLVFKRLVLKQVKSLDSLSSKVHTTRTSDLFLQSETLTMDLFIGL